MDTYTLNSADSLSALGIAGFVASTSSWEDAVVQAEFKSEISKYLTGTRLSQKPKVLCWSETLLGTFWRPGRVYVEYREGTGRAQAEYR